MLTKNCQSTNFEARHLESDTQYVFRVRAENVFGSGKPSIPSESVTTKIFEMSSDLNCYLPSSTSPSHLDKPVAFRYSFDSGPFAFVDSHDAQRKNPIGGAGRSVSTSVCPLSPLGGPRYSQVHPVSNNIKRRHSFNVHIDGGVNNILNHSEVYLNSSFSSSTSTVINNGPKRTSSNGNGIDADSSKTMSLSRGNGYRSSYQPGRKVSLSAFLPGAKAQSMNRISRGSRNSLRSSSDLNGNVTKTALLSRDFRESKGSRDSLADNPYGLAKSALVSRDPRGSHDSLNNSSTNIYKTTLLSRHSRGSRDSLNDNSYGYGRTTPMSPTSRGSRDSLAGSPNNLTNTNTSIFTQDSYNNNNEKKEQRISVASTASDVIGSMSSKEDNRRSRGSRCSLLSSQSDATVSNSHDGSRHSDYSSSMDNIDASDFGESNLSPIPITNKTSENSKDDANNDDVNTTGSLSGINNPDSISGIPSMFSSLEDLLREFGKTPTGQSLEEFSEINDDFEDDEITKFKEELRNIELTDEKLRRSQELLPTSGMKSDPFSFNHTRLPSPGMNYYDHLEDPWEKPSPLTNRVSDNIMGAPFTGDIKLSLYAQNIAADGNNLYAKDDSDSCQDFRTLRSVLQSDQTIVKPTRSMPEMLGVVVGEAGETRTLIRGKLTTIQDEDEEDDPVRVTTL